MSVQAITSERTAELLRAARVPELPSPERPRVVLAGRAGGAELWGLLSRHGEFLHVHSLGTAEPGVVGRFVAYLGSDVAELRYPRMAHRAGLRRLRGLLRDGFVKIAEAAGDVAEEPLFEGLIFALYTLANFDDGSYLVQHHGSSWWFEMAE